MVASEVLGIFLLLVLRYPPSLFFNCLCTYTRLCPKAQTTRFDLDYRITFLDDFYAVDIFPWFEDMLTQLVIPDDNFFNFVLTKLVLTKNPSVL